MACAATRLGSTMPDLTAVRYKVKREPFGEITGTHVNFFEQLLGHNRVITDPNECDSYNVDWIKMVRGVCLIEVYFCNRLIVINEGSF